MSRVLFRLFSSSHKAMRLVMSKPSVNRARKGIQETFPNRPRDTSRLRRRERYLEEAIFFLVSSPPSLGIAQPRAPVPQAPWGHQASQKTVLEEDALFCSQDDRKLRHYIFLFVTMSLGRDTFTSADLSPGRFTMRLDFTVELDK